jgi:hypothetical protein
MPLTLLTVPREVGRAWARALATKAAKGADLAAELWADHAGETGECFLCGEPVTLPCFSQLLPDYKVPDQVVVAPLCPACAGLPPMLRSHRCERLWRRMCKARHW